MATIHHKCQRIVSGIGQSCHGGIGILAVLHNTNDLWSKRKNQTFHLLVGHLDHVPIFAIGSFVPATSIGVAHYNPDAAEGFAKLWPML